MSVASFQTVEGKVPSLSSEFRSITFCDIQNKTSKMEQKVCRYNKFGFCKHKEMCRRRHFTDECKHLSACKTLGSLSKDIPNCAKNIWPVQIWRKKTLPTNIWTQMKMRNNVSWLKSWNSLKMLFMHQSWKGNGWG